MKNGVYFVKTLDKNEVSEIQMLERSCNQAKNIFYKIDPFALTDSDSGTSHVLYYENGRLTGYMTVDRFNDSDEIESAAIADNEAVFNEMYNTVLSEAGKMNVKRVLLIADRRDVFVTGLIKHLGHGYAFSEHRMNFDETKFNPAPLGGLVLRDAEDSDRAALVRMDTRAFSKYPETIEAEEISKLNIANIKTALLNGEIIGKIKIDKDEGNFGIYGFVVDPEHRNQGFGREILTRVITDIIKNGYRMIYLEVSTENDTALRLYKSIGFFIKTTFDYYECRL